MKKKLPVIVLLIVVLGVGGFLSYKKLAKKSGDSGTTQNTKARLTQPTNIIEVSTRPYLKIVPFADGRNLEIVVDEVKKSASNMEYELEYQAGTLLQGAFGALDLESLPASAKILLGSCSAGGACTYHEDVKGGSLTTKFSGEESYALKSDWKYIDNAASETAFSSKDAKFQLESTSLKKNRFLVIFNTAGYPEGLKGSLVSEIYSLTSSAKLAGSGELSIRANEEGDLTIMGWDGSAWHEFDTTTDGKMATATVDLMELYVVVK